MAASTTHAGVIMPPKNMSENFPELAIKLERANLAEDAARIIRRYKRQKGKFVVVMQWPARQATITV